MTWHACCLPFKYHSCHSSLAPFCRKLGGRAVEVIETVVCDVEGQSWKGTDPWGHKAAAHAMHLFSYGKALLEIMSDSNHENHLSQSGLAWWSQTASPLEGIHVCFVCACVCVCVCERERERERERDPLIYYLKSTVTFRTFSPFSKFLNTYPYTKYYHFLLLLFHVFIRYPMLFFTMF